MNNLFDTLQQTLAQPAPAAQPQQAQIQNVLATKKGKAAPGGGPVASNLGETQALATGAALGAGQALEGKATAANLGAQSDAIDNKTQVANANLAAAGRSAATNLATTGAGARTQIATRETVSTEQHRANEALKTTQINNAADQKLKELAAERRVTTADLFASFEQSNKELEFRKDAAQLEQAGVLMAMRDKAYLDEIGRIGEARNLNDEIAFREEVTRLEFGNELSDLMSKLGFQSTYNMDEREFEKQLGSINANFAVSIAQAAIRDSNNRAIAEGATSAVKEGADAWAKYEYRKEKDSKSKEGSTEDEL